MENKAEKFKRVAEARTNKIVDMIRLLGNCAKTDSYEYTEKDVKKIFSYIEEELKECKSKYKATIKKDSRFTLED